MSDAYLAVANAAEIPPGGMKRVEIAGKRVLLVNVEGQFYALDDTCSHEDASLYLGCLEGHYVKCSLHGSRFDVRTGVPLEEPAEEAVAVFPVRVRDGMIQIGPAPNPT